jgi:hypothetical protein
VASLADAGSSIHIASTIEVVSHGSNTTPQPVSNLNDLIRRFNADYSQIVVQWTVVPALATASPLFPEMHVVNRQP